MATLSELRDEVRFLTRTDTSTYSNTDVTREVNVAYRKLIAIILKVSGYRQLSGKEVITDLLSTSGLSSGDLGFNGEYPFPTDLVKIDRIELTYTDSGTPVPATIYHMSENAKSESDEDSIQSTFSVSNPGISIYRGSLKIRPLKTTAGDITAGIHIWYEKRQTDLSGDSDEPIFEENFHDLLALMASTRYFLRHPRKRNSAINREAKSTLKEFRAYYRKQIPKAKKVTPFKDSFKVKR